MPRLTSRSPVWILLPLLATVGLLLWHGAGQPHARGFDDDARFVHEGNAGRVVRSFDPNAEQGRETPLLDANREGLPVDIRMDKETWSRMLYLENRTLYKTRVTSVTIAFANRPPVAATVRLRGGGSLGMPGKPTFNVSLLRTEQFAPGIKLKHLYLSNARFDPHGVKFRFAYSLLSELGLFPLHVQYARVTVNGSPLGLFMLMEPPEHGIRRVNDDCVSIYRRFSSNMFENLWSKRVPLRNDRISRLIALGVRDENEPVSQAYEEILDIDQFLTWLAVNSAVLNTDTTDELFLFESRKDTETPGRLHIMAWDYDDILVDKPRRDAFPDPLLFSCRDPIERHVQQDPVLNARFRAIFTKLLEGELSADRLVARLRDAKTLRDSLDEIDPATRIYPPSVLAEREARAAIVTTLELNLRARNQHLRSALGMKPIDPVSTSR